jgi:hypothetical protein
MQPGLFDAPFESLPLRDAIDFYKHDKGWSNRLVAGDSLLVMNSPVAEGGHGRAGADDLHRPALRHQVRQQLPALREQARREGPQADADLTQEPEMIKAFRDTWELGIHSYLTYLRDRLLLAKELLSESGSVFVQISDENLHGFSGEDKRYVVQTAEKVIERCLLMTTDPGDLVLDPTCGSGTTAYVAEKWGRRWITCDTSRVAVTLAKQRLDDGELRLLRAALSARRAARRLHLEDGAACDAEVHRQQPGHRRDLRTPASGH